MADEPTTPLVAGPPIDLDLATPGQPTSLSGYNPVERRWNPDEHKAQSAKIVAMVIVGAFAGTILLVLIAIAVIIGVTKSPEETKRFADTLVSVLDSLGKFLTAVFAPLLAFVLGYYFGERHASSK